MTKASKTVGEDVFDEAAIKKVDALLARGADFDRDLGLKGVALETIPEVTAFDGSPLEKLREILVIFHRLKTLVAEKGRGGRLRPGPEVALLESALGVALNQSEVPQHILVEILEHYTKWGGPIINVHALHSALIETERTAEANGRLGFHLRWAASKLLNALRPAANELDGPKRENWEKRFKAFEPKLNEGLRLKIEPGEAWSDAAIVDDSTKAPEVRAAWFALFSHCEQMPRSARPSEKWLRTSRDLIDGIGLDAFREHVVRWFALVDKPRTIPLDQPTYRTDANHSIRDEHLVFLRGLVWCCAGDDDREVARSLAKLALSSYRKLPGIGPRLISLGNACVAVLGSLPSLDAIGQLAMLKTRVKFGTALREIEKAFDAAAKREGLPRAEIEELSVPGYGMEEVGRRIETFGNYTAALSADDGGVAIHWSKADGSPLKSVPAAIKTEHAQDWKELQAAAKDAEKMLTTVRDRLDSLFLSRKSWPYATWRERYLDHPLVGVVARRLIWTLEDAGRSRDAVFAEGRLVDGQGEEIEAPGDGTTVALWHPIGRSVDEVLGWRTRLEQFGIRQPFKQAHREVYLLTDAERRTATYSNRFAAHILKQHQFQALCVARGWKSKLRLMVDDSFPPASRLLPEWGLRAEFWVEGIGEETNDQGTYLYLASDQVRFYPIDAAQVMAHASGGGYSAWGRDDEGNRPLPLEEVPPLVLSEVMRDVDLFVGVASVGNDPNWADGGRHVDYWREYSFGDLSATAETRKAVLERLVPRLKIADRCRFADRFLFVRGDLRTYKIHLGSGNILMEPNDQYLCIVPKPSAEDTAQGKLFLPFEGDKVLSIILSKALMLADDRKIKDVTITRQIALNS